MTTKTYNELLDELDSYNQRTKTATNQYEANLTDIQTAVTSCENSAESAAEIADKIGELPSATVPTYVLGVLTTLTETFTDGDKVTTYTYTGDLLTQSVSVYIGETTTTTYTYDIDGTFIGATTV